MPEKKNTEDAIQVRPFADVLQEIDRGKFHNEISDKLHELTSRVEVTRRGGQLVVTFKVAPMKKNPDVLEVTADVATKLPQNERKASIFYADANGNLTRTDPNQLSFEGLREVPADHVIDSAKTQEKQA